MPHIVQANKENFWQYHNTLYNNWDGEETGWAGQENIVRFAQENNLEHESIY